MLGIIYILLLTQDTITMLGESENTSYPSEEPSPRESTQ